MKEMIYAVSKSESNSKQQAGQYTFVGSRFVGRMKTAKASDWRISRYVPRHNC